MSEKLTDARRLLARGAKNTEINATLRLLHGSGFNPGDLATLRREVRAEQAATAAAEAEAKRTAEMPLFATNVAAHRLAGECILLKPDGTWLVVTAPNPSGVSAETA